MRDQLTVYCVEPLCLQTGACTGPRFVPHLDQFDWLGQQRVVRLAEKVAGARAASDHVAKKTGVKDTRTEQEIAKHIQGVQKRMRLARDGDGDWKR